MDTYARISTPDRMEELQAQNERLQSERSGFEETIAALNTEKGRLSGVLARANNSIRLFEDRLKDALLNEEIENDIAESFADIFSFTLTQDVEVVFTVTFRGTACVPLNQIIEEIDWEDEVNFDCNGYGSEIEFDLYADGVDVEVQQ
jgi:predicted nuclease with TOPRIM domain